MSKNKKYLKHNEFDPLYQSDLIAKLINRVMLGGKKNTASRLVYAALEKVKKETGENPAEVLNKAIENIKPTLEVRARRVGGSTYQVPADVRPARQLSLALRWLVIYARDRKERGMQECLSKEIIDAFNKTGNAMKKREDVHRMADSNRAFAHYSW